MSRPWPWRLAAALVALLVCACTDAELEEIPTPPPPPRDDTLRVDGALCTRPPDALEFPLRVLFLVDGSESMETTDPVDPATGETRRQAAVRETWTRLLQGSEGAVKVGIARFSAQAQSRTVVDLDGDDLPESFFSDDPAVLEIATQALAATDRTTNYLNALDEAYFELRTEMLRADEEALSRSRYVVVFLSDGLPDEAGAEGRRNTAGAIVDAVGGLQDLADLFGVPEFAFHTVYLSAGQGPALDQAAQDLLGAMAQRGGGNYRSVPSGERLDFLGLDLARIRRVFRLRSLVAVHQHLLLDAAQVPPAPLPAPTGFKDVDGDGRPGCGDPLVDSDGDGLADVRERLIGSDPADPDTDRDGVRDRIEWALGRSGLDPLDPTDTGCRVLDQVVDRPDCGDADGDGVCDCGVDSEDLDGDGRCDDPDGDGDGLNDCEEIYLGTSRTAVDTDADGLPDLLEFRAGTSPVQADGRGDLDWDHTDNALEATTLGDPRCDDAAARSQVALGWQLEDLGLEGERNCARFTVDRITLLPTAGADPGLNRVLFFAGEGAFDERDAFAGWRVACVEARYLLAGAGGDLKSPPSGRLRLADDDFVDARAFDPVEHCVRGF
ncbi:MAG: VWA domain-containing protein [Myxococcales bacterium]|nr:VWA domain-containing protein [Myxococcales bacterium]MCB9522542.1 VWA domain-containing protein [Myxococcales bacterium]